MILKHANGTLAWLQSRRQNPTAMKNMYHQQQTMMRKWRMRKKGATTTRKEKSLNNLSIFNSRSGAINPFYRWKRCFWGLDEAATKKTPGFLAGDAQRSEDAQTIAARAVLAALPLEGETGTAECYGCRMSLPEAEGKEQGTCRLRHSRTWCHCLCAGALPGLLSLFLWVWNFGCWGNFLGYVRFHFPPWCPTCQVFFMSIYSALLTS